MASSLHRFTNAAHQLGFQACSGQDTRDIVEGADRITWSKLRGSSEAMQGPPQRPFDNWPNHESLSQRSGARVLPYVLLRATMTRV